MAVEHRNGSERSELNKRRLLKAGEMAELLGVPKSWIYQRTMQGQGAIPYIKMGMYVRFDPDEVFAFLKAKREQAE